MPPNTFSLRAECGLVTVPEAALMLKYAERTLQRWIEQGRIPAAVVGGGSPRRRQWLLRLADVKAFTPPEREGLPKSAPKSKRGRPVGS